MKIRGLLLVRTGGIRRPQDKPERTLDAKMKWYRRPEHLAPGFEELRHPRK